MRIDFEGYEFHLQGEDDNRKLICITSEKEIEGVEVLDDTADFVANSVKHNFFLGTFYDDSSLYEGQNSIYENMGATGVASYKKYLYSILKNIVADILTKQNGEEFLMSFIKYLNNDTVARKINRAINELKAS